MRLLLRCLSSGWETVSRVYAEKKPFNSAQVAYTKIPRSEAKIYQKTDFLSSEGHLFTSPGCWLTSSLDVEQVRFASWSVYRVLFGNDLSNLSAVSVLSQKYKYFSSSKVRCSRFLGRLVESFFAFYFVVLKNFKIDFFNWYFVMPSRSAPAYFNSLKLKLMFLSSRLLSIVT